MTYYRPTDWKTLTQLNTAQTELTSDRQTGRWSAIVPQVTQPKPFIDWSGFGLVPNEVQKQENETIRKRMFGGLDEPLKNLSQAMSETAGVPTALDLLPLGMVKNVGKLGQIGQKAKAVPNVINLPGTMTSEQKVIDLLDKAETARRAGIGMRKAQLGAKFGTAEEALSTGTGIDAFKKASVAMRDELNRVPYQYSHISITPQDINDLTEKIRLAPSLSTADKMTAEKAMNLKLFMGEGLQKHEVALLKQVFPDMTLPKAGTVGAKAWAIAVDITRIPKSIQSSYDISRLARQNLVLSVRHPTTVVPQIKSGLGSLFSQKYADNWQDIIKAKPHFAQGQEAGLVFEEMPQAHGKLPKGVDNEWFPSRIANKIPGILPSNRAWVAMGNSVRADVWEYTANKLEQASAKGAKITQRDYDEMARGINIMSGIGEWPKQYLGKGMVWNDLLYSPKYLASRFQVPILPIMLKSPAAKKEAASAIAATIGMGVTFLGAMKLMGVGEVELDPRSSDFGKLKVGNRRYDIWAGWSQIIRFLAQETIGQTKNTTTGKISEQSRLDTAFNFLQTKLSPWAGTIADVLRQKTYIGEPVTVQGELENKLAPLGGQDLYDAFVDEGLIGASAALPSLIGVGVQTYQPKTKSNADRYRSILR